MSKSDITLATTAIILATVVPAPAQSDGEPPGGRVFSEETPSFSHHVQIPPPALALVVRSRAARSVVGDLTAAERRNIAQYFVAETIQLTKSKERALLIRGLGKMSGADNDWYWIVASYKRHPRIILFAGCLSLEIRSKTSNGYDDIRAQWNSASFERTQLFRFDGKVYRLARNRSGIVRPIAPIGSAH
jgi:hypothetical protein